MFMDSIQFNLKKQQLYLFQEGDFKQKRTNDWKQQRQQCSVHRQLKNLCSILKFLSEIVKAVKLNFKYVDKEILNDQSDRKCTEVVAAKEQKFLRMNKCIYSR